VIKNSIKLSIVKGNSALKDINDMMAKRENVEQGMPADEDDIKQKPRFKRKEPKSPEEDVKERTCKYCNKEFARKDGKDRHEERKL